MKIWALLLLLSTSSFADESIFDGTDPLTDQELQGSETYIHQGKAERVYKEQCVNEDGTIKTDCTSDTSSAFTDDQKVEKTIEQMMPMIGPAYSMIMGQFPVKYIEKSNGGPVLTDGKEDYIQQKDGTYKNAKTDQLIDPNSEQGKDLEKKTKDGQDYCGYIPQVGTTAVTFYEQTMDQKTQQNYQSSTPQTRQAASFLALAKAHKDRAKTSKIQMGVWAATGACYAAMMVTSTISANTGAILKTGAASLLAYFYSLKQKAHTRRAKVLEDMASQYPGAGDCNPYTATTCFCNEETSPASDPVNYQKQCVPATYAQNFNNDSFVCIDASGKADPACDCKAKGTCVDAKFKQMGTQLGVNASIMRNPLAGISPLTKGFGLSQLDGIANNNMAYAKKALQKIAPKDLSNINLNNKQKELASGFLKAGIPKPIAAIMASKGPSSGSIPSLATSGLSGASSMGLSGSGLSKAYSAAKPVKYGKAKGSLNKSSSSSSRSNSLLSRFRKKRKSGVTGVQIQDFATQAQREAEISKDTSKPIFDIITYRYKASAWREFRDQINKQIEEEKK